MKIFAFSDTHNMHGDLQFPTDIDIAIFAGDCSNPSDTWRSHYEITDFLNFYNTINARHKIFVAGNHDVAIERGVIHFDIYPDITYLENDFVVIDGLKIWGSPYTPRYGNWSFMRERSKMEGIWNNIPEDTDILVTHGPPCGILDSTPDGETPFAGDKSLLNRLLVVQPSYHIFGHIHNNGSHFNSGSKTINGIRTKFLNVSCVTDRKFSQGLTSHGQLIELA